MSGEHPEKSAGGAKSAILNRSDLPELLN